MATLMQLARGAARRFTRRRWQRERSVPPMRTAGLAHLRGYGIDVVYPDRTVFRHQFLEIFAADCYGLSRLPPCPCVVDGGANIGLFALCVLWWRPRAHVVCFEPARTNLTYLTRNLSPWQGTQVTIVNAALGRSEGQGNVSADVGDDVRVARGAGGDVVRIVPLDEACKFAAMDLLKIDVEGSEVDVLAGAGACLARTERVVVECHGFAQSPSVVGEVVKTLEEHGFDRFSIDGLRDFTPDSKTGLVHCCLLHAGRSHT